MGLLPEKNADRIAFFTTRNSLWTTNATAIGTTTTAVSALQTLATAASASLAAQETAQNAAKAATETVNSAMVAMTNAGMAIIEQVRTKVRSAGDSVYPLANIPAPATPAPVGPPGTPDTFKVSLDGAGGLILTWKCANPVGSVGTMYQVFRRVTPTGEFTYIGGTGVREFTDVTVPAGSSQVTYKIQAIRSTAVGLWAQFNVLFGVSGSGEMTAAVAPASPRIAA